MNHATVLFMGLCRPSKARSPGAVQQSSWPFKCQLWPPPARAGPQAGVCVQLAGKAFVSFGAVLSLRGCSIIRMLLYQVSRCFHLFCPSAPCTTL